jgi:hypothetical protein
MTDKLHDEVVYASENMKGIEALIPPPIPKPIETPKERKNTPQPITNNYYSTTNFPPPSDIDMLLITGALAICLGFISIGYAIAAAKFI